MPIYTYYDEKTDYEIDVFHTMSECEKPSKETLKKITYEGRLMKRKLVAANFVGGRSKEDKISMLKKRASKHRASPNEVERRKNLDGETKKQF